MLIFPQIIKAGIFSKDSTKKNSEIIGFPIAYYTPETSVALGGAGMYYFKFNKDTLNNTSNIQLAASYTFNNQILLQLPYRLFLEKNNYYTYGEISYFQFPYQFYGIGNKVNLNKFELFTATYSRIRINFLKKVFTPSLFTGIHLYADDYYNIDKKENGKLSTSNIIGANGGRSSGLGINILYDKRNNIFSPYKGFYFEFKATWYSNYFLSDYDFTSYILDIRKYFSLDLKHTLSFQTFFELKKGTVPFNQLAMLGGLKKIRGYYQGSYRDKNMGLIQAEYRFNFYKRFSTAFFGGIGSVYNNIHELKKDYFKHSYGIGLRYLFDKKENIKIRLDYGIGENSDGIYITINEAF